MIAVIGRRETPARKAEYRASSSRKSVRNVVSAVRAPYTASVSIFATEKFRSRNSRSGSIGVDVCSSYTTKAPSRRVPPTMPPTTSGSPQPSCGCSMKPATSRPSPATQRHAPGTSTRRSARRNCLIPPSRCTSRRVAAAIGTLRMKITRQLEASTSQPPTVGPITNEIPLHAVHWPIAAPRAGPENVAVSTASEAGTRSAPATPCRPRKTMSAGASGAIAQRTEANAKLATPKPKMRNSP